MRDKSRHTLYMIAGFYLIYLAFQMYQGLEEAGDQKLLIMIAIGAFAVIGAGVAAFAVRNLYQDSKLEAAGAAEEDDEASPEAEEPELNQEASLEAEESELNQEAPPEEGGQPEPAEPEELKNS